MCAWNWHTAKPDTRNAHTHNVQLHLLSNQLADTRFLLVCSKVTFVMIVLEVSYLYTSCTIICPYSQEEPNLVTKVHHVGLSGVHQFPVQYSTVQYSTVQYSTVQYSTVQYSTVQYNLNTASTCCTNPPLRANKTVQV